MPMLFYTPSAEQLQTQSKPNNQGRSGDSVSASRSIKRRCGAGTTSAIAARGAYEWMTGEDIARELARIDLPLSTYTQWYWKIDLHNLLHFLELRVDTHAAVGDPGVRARHGRHAQARGPAQATRRGSTTTCAAPLPEPHGAPGASPAREDGRRHCLVHAERPLGQAELRASRARQARGAGVPRQARRRPRCRISELDLRKRSPPEFLRGRFASAVPKVDKPPVE